MRSQRKQFESICQDSKELNWVGVGHPILSRFDSKHELLLEALQPFIEAANQIPEGTSPDETVYSVFPPMGLFVGDFYKLLTVLGK
jgi:hypothetical protein